MSSEESESNVVISRSASGRLKDAMKKPSAQLSPIHSATGNSLADSLAQPLLLSAKSADAAHEVLRGEHVPVEESSDVRIARLERMIQQMHNEQSQANEINAGLMRSSTLQSRSSVMTGATGVGADGIRQRKQHHHRNSFHVLGAGGIGTVVTAWDGSTEIPDGHLHHLHNESQHPHDVLNDVPSILLTPQMARVRSRSSSLSSAGRQGSVVKSSAEAVVLVDQPAASPEAAAEPHHHGPPPFFTGLYSIVTASKLNWLLLAVPPALFSPMFHNETLQFVLALVSILPLAGLLGDATEEFANYTSETMGGLVNATFGNAVELIIGIVALKAGLLRVVQASILGSILSNLLLVLGFAFLAAGIKYKSCEFNVTAAQTTTSLLFISCLGITVPAAFSLTDAAGTDSAILSVSRATGVMLFLVYIAYLVFQLKTHAHLYEDEVNANMELMQESPISPAVVQAGAAQSSNSPMQGVVDAAGVLPVMPEAQHELEDEEEEEEEPKLTLMGSIIMLASVTVIVGVIAEWLVDSIDAVTKSWGMSETFVAIIILPIVGNAAEHATAVQVALAGRINLAIGVAVGSSVQIACGVFPLLVIIGWFIGQPLTFYFKGFETVITVISIIFIGGVLQDGRSTWLEGFMLLSCYVIVAVAFFFHGDN